MRAVALLLCLALAGCSTITGDPEATARAALEELVGAITDGSGSLSRLEGTLSGGGYSVPFTFEVSRDGTRHANLSAGGFAIDVYCKGDQTVRIVGGEAFAARGGCPIDGGEFGGIPSGSLDALNVTSTSREGVFLVATFAGPEPPADAEEELGMDLATGLTLRIDGRGNVRQITMSAPGQSGINATASHEPRKRWTLPETDKRLAAVVEGDTDFDDGTYEWEVDDAYDRVSLAEIEVRVNDSAGREVARFRPSGGEQNVSGLLFRFVDGDEDGLLSESDSFTIADANWTHASQYEVVVWDTWADAPLAERRIPESPLVLALALAVALALVHRPLSRQRG